mmetsp:Transcript_39895/g.78555  ORF Transcript_39895/g.78555 Transcript_39895/m.78555 type:complete len:262 (-) Transcript_39895:810-1595(-)
MGFDQGVVACCRCLLGFPVRRFHLRYRPRPRRLPRSLRPRQRPPHRHHNRERRDLHFVFLSLPPSCCALSSPLRCCLPLLRRCRHHSYTPPLHLPQCAHQHQRCFRSLLPETTTTAASSCPAANGPPPATSATVGGITPISDHKNPAPPARLISSNAAVNTTSQSAALPVFSLSAFRASSSPPLNWRYAINIAFLWTIVGLSLDTSDSTQRRPSMRSARVSPSALCCRSSRSCAASAESCLATCSTCCTSSGKAPPKYKPL